MQGRDCLGSRRAARSAEESSSGAETGQLRRGRRSKRLSRSSVWRYARLDTQPTPSERSATAGMLLLSCCRPPADGVAPAGRSPGGRKRKARGGGRASKASRGENPRGCGSISLVQQLLLEGGSPRRYYVLSDGRRGRKCGAGSKHGVDATSGNDMTDLKLSMGHPTYLETPPPLRARTDLDLDFNKPPMPCPGVLSKHQMQPLQLQSRPPVAAASPPPAPCTMITGGLCGFMECGGTQVLHAPTTYVNVSNPPVMLLPEYSVVAEPCVTPMGLDFYTVNSEACPTFVLAHEKVPMCYSQPRGDWR